MRCGTTAAEWISRVTVNAHTNRVVIKHITVGILATYTGTGILTFVTHTGFIAGAIGIDHAFRAAVRRWSVVIRQTWTWGEAISILTLRIWPTRGWNAWISWNCRGVLRSYNFNRWNMSSIVERTAAVRNCVLRKLTGNWTASCEWITSESVSTRTNWAMVIDTTICVCATYICARIFTFLIHTGLIAWTLWTDNTFRPACWGTSYIFWETWADSLVINLATLTVRAAGRWLTRVHIFMSDGCRRIFDSIRYSILKCISSIFTTSTKRSSLFLVLIEQILPNMTKNSQGVLRISLSEESQIFFPVLHLLLK